jgi:hypothetical protein
LVPLGRSAVDCALSEVIERYGLARERSRASGSVDGFELGIDRETVDVFGNGRQTAERLVLRTRFPKKLDLGLRVTLVAESDPRRPFTTGDEPFDRRYVCVADDPERARGVLSAELRAPMCHGPETDIADSAVTVAIGEADAERLSEAVSYALELARGIEAARKSTGPARPLRGTFAAWMAVAREQSLEVDPTPLSVSTRSGCIECEARAVRDGFEQYHFELRAVFPAALDVGLLLRPHSAAHEHGREADPLGDPIFDRVFVANAKKTPVLPLFDSEVRGRLIALRGEGLQMRGDDRGFTAWQGFRRDDPEGPLRLLQPLAELAEAVLARVEASAHARK